MCIDNHLQVNVKKDMVIDWEWNKSVVPSIQVDGSWGVFFLWIPVLLILSTILIEK